MKAHLATAIALGLATPALAQSAGSTYPEGSNLPQRTEGQLAPNTSGQMGGSGGANSASRAGGTHAHHARKAKRRAPAKG